MANHIFETEQDLDTDSPERKAQKRANRRRHTVAWAAAKLCMLVMVAGAAMGFWRFRAELTGLLPERSAAPVTSLAAAAEVLAPHGTPAAPPSTAPSTVPADSSARRMARTLTRANQREKVEEVRGLAAKRSGVADDAGE